jgi:HK97 gp10 family phage protein
MEIVDHSQEFIEEMKRKLEAGMAALGETAAARAADVAPVDTGRLKNSISWATKDQNGGHDADSTPLANPEDNAVYIGTNVEYAAYQEYGTSKIPGKHFLKYGANATFGDYAKTFLENALKS